MVEREGSEFNSAVETDWKNVLYLFMFCLQDQVDAGKFGTKEGSIKFLSRGK